MKKNLLFSFTNLLLFMLFFSYISYGQSKDLPFSDNFES